MVISQDFFSFRWTSTTGFALLWDQGSLFTEWIPSRIPIWVQDLVRCSSWTSVGPAILWRAPLTVSIRIKEIDLMSRQKPISPVGITGTWEQKLWESLRGWLMYNKSDMGCGEKGGCTSSPPLLLVSRTLTKDWNVPWRFLMVRSSQSPEQVHPETLQKTKEAFTGQVIREWLLGNAWERAARRERVTKYVNVNAQTTSCGVKSNLYSPLSAQCELGPDTES